ncbi:MAG TPA: ATP-binding protein, partial [Hyphomicrobiaceae bacterium]|nr:ATP-binding protein [Hyphomicrobiaceae bacterium]
AISEGRLDERVNFSSRDELGVLGASFDRMAGRVEESLRTVEARERYLQALIDAVPDAIRVIDEDFNVVNANASYAARNGRTIAEVMGQKCYATSHARDAPCAPTMTTCPVVELARRSAPIVFRQRHVTPDGGDIPVEISAAPLELETAGGTRQRLIVEVIRDLSTDLKLSQEQRLSELGLLAAGVAHEIHNPLASIQLGLASLTRSLGNPDHSDASESIRIIEHEIGRCMEVSSRLLKLSQGPGRRDELVVLNDVVADVVSLLKAEALKLGIEFRLDFTAPLRVLASDSDMRMLTLNLAQNAIHAMPDGGTLTVKGRHEDDKIIIGISDTGVGIAPQDLQRIFDPFWSRRADGVQGTGLGLSICREILNGLGGQIGVVSTLGKGTCFTVTLPSADSEDPAS